MHPAHSPETTAFAVGVVFGLLTIAAVTFAGQSAPPPAAESRFVWFDADEKWRLFGHLDPRGGRGGKGGDRKPARPGYFPLDLRRLLRRGRRREP